MRPKIYNEEIVKLCKYKHYTAIKIIQLLQKKYPTVGQATVYRTLNFLVSEGLLRKIKGVNSCAYYETSIGNHGHAIDKKTGKIYDFELPKNLLETLNIPPKFNVSNADIKIYGSIETCKNQK